MMKTITLLITIMASTYACSQSNVITKEAFDNIEINDVKLIDIRETLGQEQQIIDLFGNVKSKNIDPDGDFYQYFFEGFKISFSSFISDGTHDRPIISGFEILNNNVSMTIQGITFTIGDNISVLGSNIVFNTRRDGSKSILYQFCVGCNDFIAIDFDQQTKVITDIYYIDMT